MLALTHDIRVLQLPLAAGLSPALYLSLVLTCLTYARFSFLSLQGLSAVLVAVFNTIMKTTTGMLSKFERHPTLR